jgi:hypothetical protein
MPNGKNNNFDLQRIRTTHWDKREDARWLVFRADLTERKFSRLYDINYSEQYGRR